MSHMLTLFCPVTYAPVEPTHTITCFQSRIVNGEDVKVVWREGDLNTLGQRSEHAGGQFDCYTLKDSMQFLDMARYITGHNKDLTDAELQQVLITDGHCVELAQIDQKITDFETGAVNTGLDNDGYATFHFVDNGNGTVSVVDVVWIPYFSKWNVYRRRFAGDYRWSVGDRVINRLLACGM